jgi:hypothetical protein
MSIYVKVGKLGREEQREIVSEALNILERKRSTSVPYFDIIDQCNEICKRRYESKLVFFNTAELHGNLVELRTLGKINSEPKIIKDRGMVEHWFTVYKK